MERHLANEPVTAGPPTVSYRFSKFLRRNKAGVGVAAAILISLVGGLALATIGFARARDEATKARAAQETAATESAMAGAINVFLVDDILGQASADEALEPDLTIRTALDRAAARADTRLSEQPLVLARIHEVLRGAYKQMGLSEKALAEAHKAYEILLEELGEDSPKTLYARYQVAHMLLDAGAWEECLVHLEPVLKKRRETLGESHPETLWALHKYLFAATIHRPEVDVISLARSFVATTESVEPDDPFEAYRTLAWVLSQKDRGAHAEEIERLLQRSLKGAIEAGAATNIIRSTLAGFLEAEGRYAEAATLYRELIHSIEETDGTSSIKLVRHYNQLALILAKEGNLDEARIAQERAADIAMAPSNAIDPENLATLITNRAASLRALSNTEEAHSLLVEAYPRILKHSGKNLGERSRRFLSYLALSHQELGAPQDAKQVLRQPVEQLIQTDGFLEASEEEIFANYLQVCHELGEDLAENVGKLGELSPNPVTPSDLDRITAGFSITAGDSAANKGNWELARSLFDVALGGGRTTANPVDVTRYGTVLFRLGDDPARRQTCKAFMDRFEPESETVDGSIGVASAAKVLFLSVCDIDDPLFQRALRLSRKLTGDFYKGGVYPWFCLGRGMAEYRAGYAQRSLSWLELATNASDYNGDCRAAAHAVHALASYQLGFSDDAKRHLEAAEELAIRRLQVESARDDWFDAVVAQIALEEAHQKIRLGGTQLIAANGRWTYLCPSDGVDPVSRDPDFHQTFAQLAFDDSFWPVGRDSSAPNGGFGYGDPSEVMWETPQQGNRKSAYLRHRFTTKDSFNNLVLRLRVDDGVIVYLDGMEVGRFNVAAEANDRFGIRASRLVSNSEERHFRVIPLSGSLQRGEHVLALSIHNASPDSSDLWVRNISLQGTPAE